MTTSSSREVDDGAGRTGVGKGLYVVGMHRSGTSAITGLLIDLGIAGPPAEDRLPGGKWNERGNNESHSLNRFNEDLLRRAGGFWSAPTRVPPASSSERPWEDRRATARELLTSVFGVGPFVWKDPRNSILLPFWRSVAGSPRAAVFVYRNPFEVAASLTARNGFVITHGLALWERYVRSATAHLHGVPTMALSYDRVLGEPERWGQELVEFLRAVGFETHDDITRSLDRSLDRTLRHHRTSPPPTSEVHESQRRVLHALEAVSGAHFPWSSPDLGDEPEWVEDVLTIWRRYMMERQAHRRSPSAFARGGLLVRRARRKLGGGDRSDHPE